MTATLIELPETTVHLEGYVWLQNLGEVDFVDSEYAGTRGQSRRMEGFEINLVDPPGDLAIEYAVYASNIGWMPAVSGGTYAGTKGQSDGLQAFWMKLINQTQGDFVYYLTYMTHQENNGDVETGTFGDGNILPMGGPGSGLRLEGLALTVQQEPA